MRLFLLQLGKKHLIFAARSELRKECILRDAKVGGGECGERSRLTYVRAVDHHLPHGDIGRKNFSIAVQDHSAMRRDREADRMFLGGESCVLLMLDDLQIDKACRKAR